MHARQLQCLPGSWLGATATCTSPACYPKPLARFAQQQRKCTLQVLAKKIQVTGVTVRSSEKARPRPQQQTSPSSSSSSSGFVGAFNSLCSPLNRLVGTPTYTALQVAVLVVTLGLVDAAYSGDWSRIGAISKETEQLLQQVVLLLAGLRVVAAAVAAAAAQQAGGVSWVGPAVKGFLFGTLGVYEFTSKAE